MKNRKGFTLAEVLIVVAIIAVLVSISIPVFTSQLEKSRRAVDVANARSVYATLAIMLNDGTIDLSTASDTSDRGVWVFVQSDKRKNNAYQTTFFAGANPGVTINGEKKTTSYGTASPFLQSEVEKCFGKDGVRLCSGGYNVKIDDKEGWDWYIVEFYMDSDNTIKSRIYSGQQGSGSTGITTDPNNTVTGIEKWMGRTWPQ